MRIINLKINNFRGIKHCDLNFAAQTVLVGDSNTGKSTILEAIDLVLGPERASRRPVIDEHDFFAGKYFDDENKSIDIWIEVIVADLDFEQRAHFINHIEWWDTENLAIIEKPPPEATDAETTIPVLRVGFRGYYDSEEDDFFGKTFFISPKLDDGTYEPFSTGDKRKCGFLYLRTLRTGNRALSLERGSLLDIILKLHELKPQMWEEVLSQLREISVASKPELGISEILTSVQNAVRKLVPIECADAPTIRVSQMTREHLRQILTVFMGTGINDDDGVEYIAPFHHQGTGTINTLVLSLLSMIAELKQNVIFAMEEPEIAIPPHTQKRIIKSVIGKSAQAIFTSHSPYVLEEFEPAQILVVDRKTGELTGVPAHLPVKPKDFRDEVKRRFCEALLARRVLIVEGRTEYDTLSRLAEKLEAESPERFASLGGLGIAVISADTDNQIASLGEHFKKLGKSTYAIYDKQSCGDAQKISSSVDFPFESPENGFERLVINHTSEQALRRYAAQVICENKWPSHIDKISNETATEQLKERLMKYFKANKAESSIADCLCICTEAELPQYIVDTLQAIRLSIISSEGTLDFADGGAYE